MEREWDGAAIGGIGWTHSKWPPLLYRLGTDIVQNFLPEEENYATALQSALAESGDTRELKTAEEGLQKAERTLARKEEALGVNERLELRELAKSEYMQLRMNARALKYRLRARLRARKFELDEVERAYRRLVNGA